MGDVVVHALRSADIVIQEGEFVAIMGPSGSGKSTFMNLIGCLDRPTGGHYELNGVAVAGLNDNELADIRNKYIGFVFQTFNLLPRTSALKNVELPLMYAGVKNRLKRAEAALAQVGLQQRMDHKPSELSGGQQQRVAIARALANNPPLLLCDEPTGNLDQEAGALVLQTLRDIRAQNGTTVVIVTHDPNLANQADRVMTLVDGRIVNGHQEQHPPVMNAYPL